MARLADPIFGGAGGGVWPGRTNIGRSVGFDGSTQYLSQTSPGADTATQEEWTLSAYVRTLESPNWGHGSNDTVIFGVEQSSANMGQIRIVPASSAKSIRLFSYLSSVAEWDVEFGFDTMFDDHTGYYHILVSYDSNEATADDRIRCWVNNVELTPNYFTAVTLGQNSRFGFDYTRYINRLNYGGTEEWDGLFAQIAWVGAKSVQQGDFTAGAASGNSFVDVVTAGNDTYIAPKSNSDILTLVETGSSLSFLLGDDIAAGTDDSTNNNDFTPTGSPVEHYDTPSDPGMMWFDYSNAGAVSKQGRIATFTGGSGFGTFMGTHWACSGFKHIEFLLSGTYTSGHGCAVGIASRPYLGGNNASGVDDTYHYLYDSAGSILDGTDGGADSVAESVATFGGTVRITFEIDFDNNTVRILADGVEISNRTPDGDLKDRYYTIYFWDRTSSSVTQICELAVHEEEWTDTATAGATPWTVAYNSYPTESKLTQPNELANALPYTGNGTAIGSGGNAITGMGFQPDVANFKDTDTSTQWQWYDSSRGEHEAIYPDSAGAESTEAEGLDSFDSDGATVGNSSGVNTSSSPNILYGIKCNGGTTSSNTDGTITSTVQVAPEGHMSIVQITGTAVAGTIGHGLGRRPSLIIGKNLTAVSWVVWSGDMANNYMHLDTNGTEGTSSDIYTGSVDDSTFGVGTHDLVNGSSDDIIFYCFANVPGICACGSMVGNGATNGGPAYGADFAAEFGIFKREGGANDSWYVFDRERANQDGNPTDKPLYLDLTAAAGSNSDYMEFLANGTRPNTSNGATNPNGSWVTYLLLGGIKGGGGQAPLPARM